MLNANVRRFFRNVLTATCMTAASLMTAPSVAQPASASSVPTTLFAHEWDAFKQRYMASDGRIVDIEKGGLTHSEGQGYGMILAVKADDRDAFERIASFTLRSLRARKDHLSGWLYDPRGAGRVTDTNNATDGDIMIAYSLVQAALKWNDGRYLALATPIIDDIGRLLLVRNGAHVLVRPGAAGFDQTDGQVVNLSYFVYGALLLFSQVNDDYPFFEAWQSGLQLTEQAMHTGHRVAPDWVSVTRTGAMGQRHRMPKKSSYDAVRIPLYMMLGGRVPTRYVAPFDRAWNIEGNRIPKDVDLGKTRTDTDMNDSGYRAIAALAACATRNVPIPAALQQFRTTTYFASALHLMTLSAAREHYPHCTQGAPAVAPSAPVHVSYAVASSAAFRMR
ncbi:glycosyl hydrolase family 8 [Acuticoccus sp. MNP-M23]|uniref:glycosyl hydrolase family 8 n=1 Tax=Acuticoccus sp. MNP-M23 TaxID=3072793 RepID=UPI002814B8B8|nr:glycosyl hydrolase family 8 [Acuticoccus sp. MNP-M23]WMS44981.1 glycosyl hydrolase family 8 [Acuticoccus sp. MNP-M23]